MPVELVIQKHTYNYLMNRKPSTCCTLLHTHESTGFQVLIGNNKHHRMLWNVTHLRVFQECPNTKFKNKMITKTVIIPL